MTDEQMTLEEVVAELNRRLFLVDQKGHPRPPWLIRADKVAESLGQPHIDGQDLLQEILMDSLEGGYLQGKTFRNFNAFASLLTKGVRLQGARNRLRRELTNENKVPTKVVIRVIQSGKHKGKKLTEQWPVKMMQAVPDYVDYWNSMKNPFKVLDQARLESGGLEVEVDIDSAEFRRVVWFANLSSAEQNELYWLHLYRSGKCSAGDVLAETGVTRVDTITRRWQTKMNHRM